MNPKAFTCHVACGHGHEYKRSISPRGCFSSLLEMFQDGHHPFGEQPHILERQLLGHAAKVKRA
jgi:hypothetical protein